MSVSLATSTLCTVWPLISMPRIWAAFASASSGPVASLTPPALPRPPVLTWALMTTTGEPSAAYRSAMALACAGVDATAPSGMGTPYSAKSSFASCSNRSTPLVLASSSRLVLLPALGRPSGLPAVRAAPDAPDAPGAQRRPHPVHDLLRRRSWREDPRHAHPLQLADVLVRDDAAAEHDDVGGVVLLQQLEHPGELGHVRPRHDLLGGLVQARVDDLDPGVAQRPGHHFRAAVVTVEPRLGDDHADRGLALWLRCHNRSVAVPAARVRSGRPNRRTTNQPWIP